MAVRGDWLPLSPAASATRFWRCILQRPDPLRTRPSGRCRSRTGAATRCSPPARAHGARATRAGAPGRGDARPFRRTSGARRSRAARGASCAPSWGWRAASRLWRGGSSAVPSSCADRWSIWRTLYCARTAPVPSGARCAARGPRRHRMMRFQRWNAFHGRRCNIWLHGMRSSRPGGCGRAGGGRGGGRCGGGGAGRERCSYSLLTVTSYPCRFSNACRRARSRSCATISAHISRAVISGTQPSFSRAFVGSPSSVSTSAGRK